MAFLGWKQDFVILLQREVLIAVNHRRDGYHSAGNCGDLRFVWKRNPTLGLAFCFIFADMHARADRFNKLKRF